MVAVRGRVKGPTAAQLNAKVKERRQLALLQELRELTRPLTTKELLNPPVRGFPIDPTLTVRGRPIRPQTPTSVPTKSQIRQAVEPLRRGGPTPDVASFLSSSPVPSPVWTPNYATPLPRSQSSTYINRPEKNLAAPTPVVAVSPLMGGSGGSYQGSVAASPIQEGFRQPDFDMADIGPSLGVLRPRPPPLVMGPPRPVRMLQP